MKPLLREQRQALNSLSYVFSGPGMKAGWKKERLMAYYALTEREYEKVVECLKGIRQGVRA